MNQNDITVRHVGRTKTRKTVLRIPLHFDETCEPAMVRSVRIDSDWCDEHRTAPSPSSTGRTCQLLSSIIAKPSETKYWKLNKKTFFVNIFISCPSIH